MTLIMLFVPHQTNKAPFILVGFLILTIGCFLTGPSNLLGLPNSLSLMRAGMVSAGVGRALISSFQSAYTMKSGEQPFREEGE